jgi:hypothetical protein
MNLYLRLKLKIQYIKKIGVKNAWRQVGNKFKRRLGLLQLTYPSNSNFKKRISLENWKSNPPLFLIVGQRELNFPKSPSKELKMEMESTLSGKIRCFYDQWIEFSHIEDGLTHPITGYKYPLKHWTKIEYNLEENGDIRYIWERSRFSNLITVMRYDYHFQEDHSEFVFDQIMNWIENNPVNKGPNWISSQEISLRVINLVFLLYFYKDSESLTEEKWQRIQHVLYWSLHHVYQKSKKSREKLDSNQIITETTLLSVTELIFPFFKASKRWSRKGKYLLEKEVMRQINDDGTSLQNSMNSLRVIVQTFNFGFSLAQLHQKPFHEKIYLKAYSLLNFLFQSQIEENGFLPNFGINDGSLIFPFSSQEFRDFSPQLSCLHKIITGSVLYKKPYEEECWLYNHENQTPISYPKLRKQFGLLTFQKGGYYIIREKDTVTFFNCHDHQYFPAQADNLNLDIWVKGENILRDAGSYLFDGNLRMFRMFNGTLGHNTVTINRKDQMLLDTNRRWFYWTKKHSGRIYETLSEYIVEGEISAFQYMNHDITHRRIVRKTIGAGDWIVEDFIMGLPEGSEIGQHWHGKLSGKFFFTSRDSNGDIVLPSLETSFYSSYFGRIEDQEMVTFSTHLNSLKTRITT